MKQENNKLIYLIIAFNTVMMGSAFGATEAKKTKKNETVKSNKFGGVSSNILEDGLPEDVASLKELVMELQAQITRDVILQLSNFYERFHRVMSVTMNRYNNFVHKIYTGDGITVEDSQRIIIKQNFEPCATLQDIVDTLGSDVVEIQGDVVKVIKGQERLALIRLSENHLKAACYSAKLDSCVEIENLLKEIVCTLIDYVSGPGSAANIDAETDLAKKQSMIQQVIQLYESINECVEAESSLQVATHDRASVLAFIDSITGTNGKQYKDIKDEVLSIIKK